MSRPDDLPGRPWDELIDDAVRRGKRRRRHRRLAMSAPVVMLVGLLGATLLPDLHPTRTDALVVDVADRPTPAATTAPEPTWSPSPSTDGGLAVPRAGRPARQVVSTSRQAPRPAPAHVRVTAPTVAATLPALPTAVRFADAKGDADGRDGAVGAGTVSDASRDIIAMTFARERGGIRVAMELAADKADQSLYYASFVEYGSGCKFDVFLGTPEDDGMYVICDDESSEFIQLPPVGDAARELRAFVPYGDAPRGADLHRRLGAFSGQTWIQHINSPAAQVDAASTTRSIGGSA